MRFVFLSLDFGLLLLALVALFHAQVTSAKPGEACPEGNCMSANKCEIPIINGPKCPNSKNICCSVVKSKYRTLCRHHGGECMDKCNQSLKRSTTDCRGNQICCVLV